mmetsp:Transcript_50206/g.99199  ORF Transcript_50206/g.99199 Transcript_50206/m.99199 type:complete len:279 (+) Transcript_50206:145-981(+)
MAVRFVDASSSVATFNPSCADSHLSNASCFSNHRSLLSAPDSAATLSASANVKLAAFSSSALAATTSPLMTTASRSTLVVSSPLNMPLITLYLFGLRHTESYWSRSPHAASHARYSSSPSSPLMRQSTCVLKTLPSAPLTWKWIMADARVSPKKPVRFNHGNASQPFVIVKVYTAWKRRCACKTFSIKFSDSNTASSSTATSWITTFPSSLRVAVPSLTPSDARSTGSSSSSSSPPTTSPPVESCSITSAPLSLPLESASSVAGKSLTKISRFSLTNG